MGPPVEVCCTPLAVPVTGAVLGAAMAGQVGAWLGLGCGPGLMVGWMLPATVGLIDFPSTLLLLAPAAGGLCGLWSRRCGACCWARWTSGERGADAGGGVCVFL